MGSSPRVLNHDMKSTVSRSLQSLPTSSHAFEPGEENQLQNLCYAKLVLRYGFKCLSCYIDQLYFWFRLYSLLLFFKFFIC